MQLLPEIHIDSYMFRRRGHRFQLLTVSIKPCLERVTLLTVCTSLGDFFIVCTMMSYVVMPVRHGMGNNKSLTD